MVDEPVSEEEVEAAKDLGETMKTAAVHVDNLIDTQADMMEKGVFDDEDRAEMILENLKTTRDTCATIAKSVGMAVESVEVEESDGDGHEGPSAFM